MSVLTNNPIGLSTGALFPDFLTEDALIVAAEQGFETVEIYLQTHGEYEPRFVRELQQRTDDLGLSVHSVHNDFRHFDLWSPYARRSAESYALFERLIDVAAAVGATAITWHGFRHQPGEDAILDQFAVAAQRLGTQAQAAGITLTLENVSWCYLRGAEHVQKIREYRLPLGFTFDPFQAAESGQPPVDLIEAMGDRLTTVHLADFGPGLLRHLPLGEGVIDWPGLFCALETINYQGPLIVETPFRGDLAVLSQGRSFVQRLLKEKL